MVGEGNGTSIRYSCLENPMNRGTWKAAVHGAVEGRTRLSDFTFTFHLHALEKEIATHSSVLDWRIPETGEPGGLPSMGSHRVGHDWSDLAATLLYSLIGSSNFLVVSLGLLFRGSCHPQIVLLLLFQSGFLLFLFILWLLWLKLPKLCWIVQVSMGTLVFLLTLGETLSIFHY